MEKTTFLPPTLHKISKNKILIHAILLLSIVTLLLLFKARKYHRAEMIKTVVEILRDTGRLEEAERAANKVAEMFPYDIEWKTVKIRIMLLRGKYKEAEKEIRSLPQRTIIQQTEKSILMAFALAGSGEYNTAQHLIKNLPEPYQLDPLVAILRAELAVFSGDVEEVCRNITRASLLKANLPRIRKFFPFLRSHRKWKIILELDQSYVYAPYWDSASAFIAAEACMNFYRYDRLGEIIKQITSTWPDDPRILELFYFMALRENSSSYIEQFASFLRKWALSENEPENLYRHIQKCFDLNRPDLAWLLCNRIRSIKPEHPLFYLAAAQNIDLWFLFKKEFLRIPALSTSETISIKPYYVLGKRFYRWRKICESIPFGDDFASLKKSTEKKKELVEKAITLFNKIPKSEMSIFMYYQLAKAYQINENPSRMILALKEILKLNPAMEEQYLLLLSDYYEQKHEWFLSLIHI